METYYVVKKGHNVGIFKTWAECKKSVDGYKNPVFRKFETYDEAEKFANILEKNSNSGHKYKVKKIGESHDEHQ